MTSFAAMPSAFANTAPASCHPQSHDGPFSKVAVTVCDNGTVTAIGGETHLTLDPGHFEFFGPHGLIDNTVSRKWPAGIAVILPVPAGKQGAPSGSLWCVSLWLDLHSGPSELGSPNCVTI